MDGLTWTSAGRYFYRWSSGLGVQGPRALVLILCDSDQCGQVTDLCPELEHSELGQGPGQEDDNPRPRLAA